MPPSSLYCTQKSVSRISAAAANLSMAASPAVIPSSSPNAFEAEPISAAPGVSRAAPSPRRRKNERRGRPGGVRSILRDEISVVLPFDIELLSNAVVVLLVFILVRSQRLAPRAAL